MNSIKAIQNISEVPSKLNKTETAVAANKLATARTFTIGSSNKSVDGTKDISWSLSEIGAAPASHSHSEYITTDRIMDGAQAKTYLWSSDYIANNYLDYTSTAASAKKLSTARTLTIGNSSKTFDGSANVNWTLDQIGAAPKSHTHSYLPLNGGTVTGATTFNSTIYGMNNIALARGDLWLSATGSNITCDYLRFGTNIIASDDSKRMYLIDTGGARANVDMGDIKAYSLLLTNPAYPSVRFSENVRIEYDSGNDALYAAGTKLTSSGLRGFKATVCESTQYATIAGKKVFVQSETPSGISTGDVWVQI